MTTPTHLVELVKAQSNDVERLSKFFSSHKKRAGWQTRGKLDARMQQLDKKWEVIRDRHDLILTKVIEKADKECPYFKEDVFGLAEEIYVEQTSLFLDAKFELEDQRSAAVGGEGHHSTPSFHRKLPPISLPSFSGKYIEWSSFKDKFSSLIEKNSSLQPVDRLHYLNACLTGEAKKCIETIPVSNDNYQRAWERLLSLYDNERAIITSCLNNLFQLSKISSESFSALKVLRDGTTEAVETLKTLKRPVDKWDDLLVYLTVSRLDPTTRRDWATHLGASTRPSTYEELDIFLQGRILALERVEQSDLSTMSNLPVNKPKGSTTKQPASQSKVHTLTTVKAKSPCCSFCQQPHYIARCSNFRTLNVDDRNAFAVTNHLCFNCLGTHLLRDCRSDKTCGECHAKHHSLLHGAARGRSSPASTVSTPSTSTTTGASSSQGHQPSTGVSAHIVQSSPKIQCSTWLATARVNVILDDGRESMLRALIDPCSGASFISESAVQRLNMPRRSAFVPVSGIGATRDRTARSKVSVLLTSQYAKDRRWIADALILPCLTDYLPSPRPFSLQLDFVNGLPLADPRPNAQDPIEMILGIDLYTKFIESGLRKSENEEVIAQQTSLGWILSAYSGSLGPCATDDSHPISSFQCTIDTDLSASLQRFWEQEEVPVDPHLLLTHDERECEKHYVATFRRTNTGKYELHLPFKRPITELGNSYEAAKAMLEQMERRFSRDQNFHSLYQEFMNEYLSLGHMRAESPEEAASDEVSFYLPHHGVLKDGRLRTVFNGSVSVPSGYPLNKCLYVGKNLLIDTVIVMLRWRMFAVVFSADIVKAFRQIGIAKEDQRFLKILWRRTPSSPVETFRLCTVTYGVVCSPFQTNRTIQQLAMDEVARFPAASRILKENIYVDDLLAGADTVEELVSLKNELVNLLLSGNFPLRKWTTNNQTLLMSINPEDLAPALSLSWNDAHELQMLGILWNPLSDSFTFHFDPQKSKNSNTKRGALSVIAQLYDPLGWISPITVNFKIFMKSLWKNEQKWDDPLPLDLKNKWIDLLSYLSDLHLVSVPRWLAYTRSCQLVELHGFADASNDAYGAVAYLRTVDSTGSVNSVILTSKSRVSSVKQTTIARLELCGALLLVRLVKQVLTALTVENLSCHLWLDSMVALSWIKGQPARWKTYVANRVAEIQSSLPSAAWHYVNTRENPADLVSRGTTPRELSKSSLWFHGPGFLCSLATPWPAQQFAPDSTCTEELKISSHIVKVNQEEWDLVHRYSSLMKLLSVTAWCLVFIQNVKKRILLKQQDRSIQSNRRAAPLNVLPLTPSQIQAAFYFWVSHVQKTYFSEEIRTLSSKSVLSRKSSLIRLNPAIDTLNMLRVRGRLTHSLLEDDEKHPLILPREAHFARLVVLDAHEKTLHGGTQLTLNFIRQRLWIIRGRQLVRAVIFKCLKCWRLRARPSTQLMGDLPAARVKPSRPFLHTGVDYAGPVNIRCSAGRGVRSRKGYICVFVCFATRAVHLEAASDYSTREFLDVYRRFVGRRGISATLYSDCGTNFVGASRELKKLFLDAGSSSSDIARLLARDGTECRFNPPSAPHFGGLWEAAVKSVKYHLTRIIGESTLTFEEMSTLLIQIEACLNSRPLCPLNDDVSDLSALTPAHFLIGEPLNLVPEPSVYSAPDNRLARWQHVRKMVEHFWRRWSSDYLHELQQRPKWCARSPPVNVGDLCLIRSDQFPPCKWPMARVIEVIKGADGLVRVVKLRTASSTFTRPIVKISVLPVET